MKTSAEWPHPGSLMRRGVSTLRGSRAACAVLETCLSTVVDATPAGVLIVDDKGRAVACNPAFADLVGSTTEMVLRRGMGQCAELGLLIDLTSTLTGVRPASGHLEAEAITECGRAIRYRIAPVTLSGDIVCVVCVVWPAEPSADEHPSLSVPATPDGPAEDGSDPFIEVLDGGNRIRLPGESWRHAPARGAAGAQC